MDEIFSGDDHFKIFIIDDQIVNLEIIVGIFETYRPNYTLYQTNNPQNAINIALNVKPDLIITDWDMPVLNGIQLIELLKKHKETFNIPVIMVTGVHLSSNDLQIALHIGAVDFIRKPIDPIELISRVHSALLREKYHKVMLELKNQELTENSLYLIKNNKFKIDILKRLHELQVHICQNSEYSGKLVKTLISAINSQIQEESWYKFNLSFDKVHGSFRKNLLSKHPDLTGLEIKLCTFIRLGMNNKDMASLLNQAADSIKVSRSRLRKKMGLTTEQNLEGYLNSF